MNLTAATHNLPALDHQGEAERLLALAESLPPGNAQTVNAINMANAHATLALVDTLHSKFEVKPRGLGRFEVSPK